MFTGLALPVNDALAQAAAPGLGADVRSKLDNTGTGIGLQKKDLPVIVGQVIKQFMGLVGIVLVVFIIYAGYLWMTAQGNEEQVTKAKNIIKNCVIGTVLLFAAYSITDFVVGAVLKGTGIE
jgi:cytochrome bd-type quinol oxidase subunit 2